MKSHSDFSKLSKYRSSLFFIFFLVIWTFCTGHLPFVNCRNNNTLTFFSFFCYFTFLFSLPSPVLCCFSSLATGVVSRRGSLPGPDGLEMACVHPPAVTLLASRPPGTCKNDSQNTSLWERLVTGECPKTNLSLPSIPGFRRPLAQCRSPPRLSQQGRVAGYKMASPFLSHAN